MILVWLDVNPPFSKNMKTKKRVKTVTLMYQVAVSCGDSISSLFDLSSNISNIVGNTARIGQILDACKEIERSRRDDNPRNLIFEISDESPLEIIVEDLTVSTPRGRILIQDLSFRISIGENLLIQAASGTGKTSLFRILAGIWGLKESSGYRIPSRNALFFNPQNPYFIEDRSILFNVVYPLDFDIENNSKVRNDILQCLDSVGLLYLINDHNESDELISLGNLNLSIKEKQKLGIARLLFHSPIFAFLDESVSSLSEKDQSMCYRCMIEKRITFISISHDSKLQKYHNKILTITSNGNVYEFGDIHHNKEDNITIVSDILENQNQDKRVNKEEKEKTENEKNDLEMNDRNLGGSGFNCLFLKRVYRLCFGWILIKKWYFVLFTLLGVLFNLGCSCLTIPLFYLATKAMGAICERDFLIGSLYILLFSLLFGFISVFWGLNDTWWSFLMMRMRTNATKTIHEKYFKNNNLLKLNKSDSGIDNFDQRICNDVHRMVHNINNVLNVVTKAGTMTIIILILGTISTGFVMLLFIFIIGLLSSIIQISFMILISRKRYLLMKREGYFRTSLIRVQENSEQICFLRGSQIERKIVEEKFRRYMKINLDYIIIGCLNSSFSKTINNLAQSLSYLVISVGIQFNFIQFSGKSTETIVSGVQSIHYYFMYAMKYFKTVLNEGTTIGRLSGNIARVFEVIEKLDELNNEFDSNHLEEYDEEDDELDLALEKLEEDLIITTNLSDTKKKRLIHKIMKSIQSDVKSIEISSSSLVSYLPRNSYVFYGSLLENVIYPMSETESPSNVIIDEVKEVLELLKIKEIMISNLERKMNFRSILSPGEIQKIAFARAIFGNSKYIIVDNSTCSLDFESKMFLFQVCNDRNIRKIFLVNGKDDDEKLNGSRKPYVEESLEVT